MGKMEGRARPLRRRDKITMSPYYLLTVVFALCVIGAWMSYTEFKHTNWYLPLIALLGAVCAVIFGWAARVLNNNSKLYVFSLTYDSVMLIAYYLLPLLVFKTKLSTPTMIGAVLILVGFVTIKIFGD